jgi:hypothetical protein
MDVTGKAGATLYAAASDPTAPMSAWMRGSIPNYRAESKYILSGIFGNYEKELENKNTMSVVGGKVPARTVAYTIIDEAYKDTTSPDCTGSVDASGVHGVGKGTPPCTAMLKFNKPTGKCLDFVNIPLKHLFSLPLLMCLSRDGAFLSHFLCVGMYHFYSKCTLYFNLLSKPVDTQWTWRRQLPNSRLKDQEAGPALELLINFVSGPVQWKQICCC